MEIGDTYFFVRCLPRTNEFEILELKIRTITENYFVGIDSLYEKSTQQAFPFVNSDLDTIIFKTHKEAKEKLNLEREKI